MRPDPSKVLVGVAMAQFRDLPAEIRTPFGQAVAGMAGTLAYIVAQEFDRMVDRLSVENAATAAILEDAYPLAAPDLGERIREALQAREPADLKVATLQAINDSLRGVLVDVHALVETLDSPEAAALTARIWDELRESTRRRRVEVPGR